MMAYLLIFQTLHLNIKIMIELVSFPVAVVKYSDKEI